MWKCNFAEETLDYKLYWLKVLRRLWIFVTAVLAGALLFGGVYYLFNVVLAPEKTYQVMGDTYVDYIPSDAYGISRVYITEEAWKVLVRSDEFADNIVERLAAEGYTMTREEVAASVSSALLSDTRIVTTTVTAADPDLAVKMGEALQLEIIRYCDTRDTIASTFTLTVPREATLVLWNRQILVAALVGAVIAGILALAYILLYAALDDSLYLPETFENRYQIPSFGTLESKELGVNLITICKGCNNLTTVSLNNALEDRDITETLSKALPKGSSLSFAPAGFLQEDEGWLETLRETEGVVLLLAAGKFDGRQVEHGVRFLQKQGISIKGAVLCGADAKFMKLYYGSGMWGRDR